MTSAQYLTLDEFTSSPSPLPTILVPRSQALRLVELCELAEMTTPSSNFLDLIGNNGNGNASNNNNNNSGGSANPHVLVTQMALLLYLGEYTHARHLWRRHRRTSPPPSPPPETSIAENNNGNAAAASSTDDDDYAQLEQLWNVAKYCYLWSTGGIHSLTSSGSSISVGDALSSASLDNNNGMMQVENNDDDDDGDLPFSTQALRALQSCQSSQMEPLSTYSSQLLGVFRSRVNRGLHKSFDKLDCNEFCLRMNLKSDMWNSFGWKKVEEKEGGYYLMSNVDDDVVLDHDDGEVEEDDDELLMGVERGSSDGIGKLTEIVMFLEGKMNA
ncbi:hypothetical protein ACHAXR_004607 [Thalassiosira sp. AJA248-18]